MSNNDQRSEQTVEVYRCNQELEANRVIDELLGPAGIECFVHDRASHALPVPSSQTGALFIAVPAAQAAQARSLLLQARADGELDDSGGQVLGA